MVEVEVGRERNKGGRRRQQVIWGRKEYLQTQGKRMQGIERHMDAMGEKARNRIWEDVKRGRIRLETQRKILETEV